MGVRVFEVLVRDFGAGGEGPSGLLQAALVHQDDARVQVGRCGGEEREREGGVAGVRHVFNRRGLESCVHGAEPGRERRGEVCTKGEDFYKQMVTQKRQNAKVKIRAEKNERNTKNSKKERRSSI